MALGKLLTALRAEGLHLGENGGAVRFSAQLVELVTYIACRFDGHDKYGLTKLSKIIFQVDRRYYADHGETFSGLTFFKFPKGPFTKDFYSLIGGTPHLDLDGDAPGPEMRVISSREADMRPLASYIDEIDQVIEDMWDLSGGEASKESHGPAWELVEKDKHPIPLNTYLFGDHRTAPEDVKQAVEDMMASLDA